MRTGQPTSSTDTHMPSEVVLTRQIQRDARSDRAFRVFVTGAGVLVFVSLLAAVATMFWNGLETFQTFGFGFLTSQEWDPVSDKYGAVVPVYGTIVTSLIALLIAVPVSFGIALFLTEVAPHAVRRPIGMAIELLAGIPSIIYGMWGLFVLAPYLSETVFPWLDEHASGLPVIGALFSGPPLGVGIGTAGLVLAIMIIPFIASVMRDVFEAVPQRLKESAYALGSTKTEVVWDIVMPYAKSGVIGAIFLGLGRALGETMAVTFVIGNSAFFSYSLLEPNTSITATLANEFAEAGPGLHRSSLIALAFLLFVLSFIVLSLARIMLAQLKKREGA
jgi:phosphate transport system permease protein